MVNKYRLKPKTDNQAEYIRTIIENTVTFCTGPAGSGKSSCAVGLAMEHLFDKKIKRIVIARPAIETGKGIGYLPGNTREKIDPYMIPIFEEMKKYIDVETREKLIRDGAIEISPLELMRGRSFFDTFMLMSESQNATHEQLKMFVTRLGRGSKCVIEGDIKQTDLPYTSPLTKWIELMDDVAEVGVVELTSTDIIRHSVIKDILANIEPCEEWFMSNKNKRE